MNTIFYRVCISIFCGHEEPKKLEWFKAPSCPKCGSIMLLAVRANEPEMPNEILDAITPEWERNLSTKRDAR